MKKRKQQVKKMSLFQRIALVALMISLGGCMIMALVNLGWIK